jgi:putative ABC transport system substrate-binding protein
MEPVYAAFPDELRKLGWVAGRNVQIDVRSGGTDERSIRGAAEEILAAAPDILVTSGTANTAISLQQTRTIPIVFVNVADPVASGFVTNLARPGGNITGFTSVEYSLAGKWLSLLKDIAPTVTRVMVLFNPVNSNWTGYLPVIEAGAPSLQVSVNAVRASNADEIEQAIETFGREPGAGMIVLPSRSGSQEAITSLAARHRVPAIYAYDYYVESGGLVSYGSDTRDVFRRAAVYVDRILKGENVGNLPVQQPTKFELVINLKAAKALGLEVPYNLFVLADRVID